jgi:hypothetical protein
MRLPRALVGLAPIVALALGCRDDPKPSATGDRVELTTEVVPRVCRGTIEHLDDEIARIEAELALAPTSERVEIHVVDSEHIGEYCGSNGLCVLQPPRRLYITPDLYESNLRHELVRDRLARTSVSQSKPVFFEGVAGALAWPSCEPSEDLHDLGNPFAWEPPPVDEVLAASSRGTLGKEGRYLGGELVRWLLDTRGPEPLLAFMATLNRHDSADEVRVAYLEWTSGRSIDSDLFAHWRPDDAPVDPGAAGCLAPAAPLDDATSRVRLAATLDCDSPVVRNDFEDPSRVFVEWTLDVSADRESTWSLGDALPEGATFTISPCACIYEPWSFGLSSNAEEEWPEDGVRWLNAGRYRLRVYAPSGTEIDIQLQAPCDLVAQNCPTGQQCTEYGDCLAQVDEPAQLGEPCWPAFGYDETPLPCAAALTCIGPFGGDGVCMPVCGSDNGQCPGELDCLVGLACTESCDPLAPSCTQGWSCVPDFQTGSGGCLPNSDAIALLEPCDFFDFSCGPGLVCEIMEEFEGCPDSPCCTPLCDPAAAEPGCPPELPYCIPQGEAGLGTCHPMQAP